MTPCAIKRLPYEEFWDHKDAEAELEALHDTHDITSVVTCLGVIKDAAPDGHIHLQVAMQ